MWIHGSGTRGRKILMARDIRSDLALDGLKITPRRSRIPTFSSLGPGSVPQDPPRKLWALPTAHVSALVWLATNKHPQTTKQKKLCIRSCSCNGCIAIWLISLMHTDSSLWQLPAWSLFFIIYQCSILKLLHGICNVMFLNQFICVNVPKWYWKYLSHNMP